MAKSERTRISFLSRNVVNSKALTFIMVCYVIVCASGVEVTSMNKAVLTQKNIMK
jgi:hypothetical protein